MRLRAAAMDILTSTFLVCREYRILYYIWRAGVTLRIFVRHGRAGGEKRARSGRELVWRW